MALCKFKASSIQKFLIRQNIPKGLVFIFYETVLQQTFLWNVQSFSTLACRIHTLQHTMKENNRVYLV